MLWLQIESEPVLLSSLTSFALPFEHQLVHRSLRTVHLHSYTMSKRSNQDMQSESEPLAKRFANQNENEISIIAEQKLQSARTALDRLDYKNVSILCTEVSMPSSQSWSRIANRQKKVLHPLSNHLEMTDSATDHSLSHTLIVYQLIDSNPSDLAGPLILRSLALERKGELQESILDAERAVKLKESKKVSSGS